MMSGGYFDYQQYKLDQMADEILHLIESNEDKTVNDWGDRKGRFYSAETIQRFKEAVDALNLAKVYVQRIDWLVSGDDGEESFHNRLNKELNELKECDQ